MMKTLNIGTINAATVTPLKSDGGLDEASARRLCARWLDLGLDGVLLLGSMGEGMLLPERTRDAFVETAVSAVGGRLALFASAADVSAPRMIERARRYARMGADCTVLCIPPNAAPARGVAEVLAAADACEGPCAYYDVPANTGTALTLTEILQILRHENIRACKDSSGNSLLAQALNSPDHRPPHVKILDGTEYHTLFSVDMGYDGVLHGGGGLTGRWVRAIWEAARQGQREQALAMDRQRCLFLGQVYNRFSRPLQNVIGQKYALRLLGCLDHEAVCVDQALDNSARERIRLAVETHRTWLEPGTNR